MTHHRSPFSRSWAVAAGLALATSFTLTACGSGPSKGDLKDAINDAFQQAPAKCWAVQNMHASFPMRVSVDSDRLDPILAGLRKEGYIQIQPAGATGMFGLGGPSIVIALTQSGEAAHVWTPNQGFCLGKASVDTIGQWTEPANGSGTITTQADFTWKRNDLPSWAKADDFATIPGVTSPVKGKAMLVKTNKGWSVQQMITDPEALSLLN